MFDKVLTEKENRFRITYFIISFISFIAAIIIKLFYRNYINTKNINDFGLADSLPSFLFVLGAINFALYISHRTELNKNIKLIISITIGALIFEFEQIFTSQVFDVKDVIAIILGVLISLMIFYKVEKKCNIKHQNFLDFK